jgi:hypothetical protein
MCLEQISPRCLDERATRRGDSRGQRAPRLGLSYQRTLGMRVESLLMSARAERALERPRVPVRIAQFTVDERQPLRRDSRGQSFGETAERTSMYMVSRAGALECGDGVRPIPLASVVIGPI